MVYELLVIVTMKCSSSSWFVVRGGTGCAGVTHPRRTHTIRCRVRLFNRRLTKAETPKSIGGKLIPSLAKKSCEMSKWIAFVTHDFSVDKMGKEISPMCRPPHPQ